MNEKTMTPHALESDQQESSIRPESLQEFIGQSKIKKNLQIFIKAAKERNEALDHVLFYGPPGLGKTTLSQIISKELGVGFKMASGPSITKSGELAAILTNLEKDDVFFIDEIHRLHPSVEEVLYSAMEDYTIDVIIGDGPTARVMKIGIPKFTLIGATTKLGSLSNPLRDRFGIPIKLDFYSHDELQKVIERGMQILGNDISKEASAQLAKSSRGTPRIAMRLLRRVRDFSHFQNEDIISLKTIEKTMYNLEIDSLGLDSLDHKYLRYISDNYKGGPVGIETIAAGLSEDKDTIEDTVEPYLMQIGFIARTPKGRQLSHLALSHLGLPIQLKSQNTA